eukprot:CAMPEP_0171092334 /NCGR_PEP_ID=MMETSP0766_2-20121228/35629_1 /TAXON_ID=439317 /ORGANISM="Gambierdiscus australes, Strain CAWD 149" /LENGTH=38 /DNA_ID= /DNA_START= /DNA_END= /DNA_ORIENTATION=
MTAGGSEAKWMAPPRGLQLARSTQGIAPAFASLGCLPA